MESKKKIVKKNIEIVFGSFKTFLTLSVSLKKGTKYNKIHFLITLAFFNVYTELSGITYIYDRTLF